MKTLTLLLALCASAATAQTIRIADNNASRPTGPNIFSTIQAAVDAAAAGDIVFVQPSPTNYGPVIINKRITLQGIGFYPAQPFLSKVGEITLTNRADNTSNASGTIIDGLWAWDLQPRINLGSLTGAGYTLQNVTISNCSGYIIHRDGSYQATNNITISNSGVQIQINGAGLSNLRVVRSILHGSVYISNAPSVDIIISNNIVLPAAQFHFNSVISGGILANNIFLGGTNPAGSSMPRGGGLTDFLVTSNIFYGSSPQTNNGSPFERNTYTNNISIGNANNSLPPVGTGSGNTGSGNLVGQDPLFVNAPFGVNYNGNEDFNLQAGSPAKNAGFDGTDMGITGGAYPIPEGKISNTRNMPLITTFNPAGIVPQNQPVKANIKVKSN